MPKTQLNVTIDEDLAKQIKIEAVQVGMKVSRYVELILGQRSNLLHVDTEQQRESE